MSVLHDAEPVTVWTSRAVPARLVWRGVRYVVTDTPTPLRRGAATHEALTHPPERLVGWRFQGTNADDPSDVRVFDVRRLDDQCWELVATYA
jgi:hypothetical protein